MVDWGVGRKSGNLYDLFRSQSVELNPHIFPRQILICDISVNLPRENHEALTAVNLIFVRSPLGIICH